MVTANELGTVGNGSIPLLGFTVSWRINGVTIEHQALVDLLADAGLTAYDAPKPTEREALRRAVEAWVRERSRRGGARFGNHGELGDDGSGQAQRALLRAANRKGADVMRFALVTEEVNLASLGLAYTGKTYFLLNKATGDFMAVIIEDSGLNDREREAQERAIYAEVAQHFARFATLRDSGDISKAIRRNVLYGMNAVSLRDGGGYYFIPGKDQTHVDALRRVFDTLNRGTGEAFLLAMPAVDFNGAAKGLGQMAHVAFEADLATLDRELAKLLDAEPGTVRASTVAAKIDEVKALRTKAESYGELLNMRQDAIGAAVEALVTKAREVVVRGAVADDAAGDQPAFLPTGDAAADPAAAK